MAVQYWIGDFFIDLSRNQITQNKQPQTIAPKALAVLTYLAENQGRVVSHDELLAKVWHDTVVSPNTLQRSIAQLRKALGDDGKVQAYIKTHAKQGYSLECDVRWQDNIDATIPNNASENTAGETLVRETFSDTYTTNQSEPSKVSFKLFPIIAGIIILSIFGYRYFAPVPTSQITIATLRSLTATDDKEFDATYTPDGQYIVFHRYLEKQCINKLWAKNIKTQQEVQLTKEWGNYGSHSFSKDGKTLVFLATEDCSGSDCYDLMSLDFEKALESPQHPSLILRCENSVLEKPLWMGNDHIAMLQRESNRWQLISYSISENKSTDLYNLEEGNIIDFAYSARDDLIAVIRFHHDGQQYIDLLKPDGRLLSSHPIEFPPEIPKFRPINPNFTPLNEQLIFSTGRQLFTLSYEGKVAKISLPLADRMIQPEFHPDGSRLLMLKGPYDSDIVLLSLDQIAAQTEQTQIAQPQVYSSFERSNLGEDQATFQPGGELIAFWSARSGEEQLWISDGNGPHQLTHFPMDTLIRGFDWAEDGQSLLVNANYVLTQVFLDSQQKSFPLEHPVVKLYQWDSKNNSALLLARIKGLLTLVECDLDNSEIKEIKSGSVLWALKSEDGRLIYKDFRDRFWQPGPVEDQRIKPLDNQGGRAKSFVMNGNVIYAINTENQLWSYDLDNETFKILGEVGNDVDSLTDINQSQLLMTIQVAAKKEVVELSLSE